MIVEETNKSVLIGISGKMGAGKTSVAQYFVKHHDFVKLAFGDSLKKAAIEMTGLEMIYFTDPLLKEKIIPGIEVTPRQIMQLLGTELAREMIHPDFWIWRMRQSFSLYSNHDIVVDDIRFENEANLIRMNSGVVIHLERNVEFKSNHKKHKSENGIKFNNADFVVNAEDTVDMTAFEIANIIGIS